MSDSDEDVIVARKTNRVALLDSDEDVTDVDDNTSFVRDVNSFPKTNVGSKCESDDLSDNDAVSDAVVVLKKEPMLSVDETVVHKKCTKIEHNDSGDDDSRNERNIVNRTHVNETSVTNADDNVDAKVSKKPKPNMILNDDGSESCNSSYSIPECNVSKNENSNDEKNSNSDGDSNGSFKLCKNENRKSNFQKLNERKMKGTKSNGNKSSSSASASDSEIEPEGSSLGESSKAFVKRKKAKSSDNDDNSSVGQRTNEDDGNHGASVDEELLSSDLNNSVIKGDDCIEQVSRKPKRYQLLSDDDSSNESTNSTNPVWELDKTDHENSKKSSNVESDSDGRFNSSKTEKRKKKLQKLNDLKRKEIENNRLKSSSNASASDSENESGYPSSLGKPSCNSGRKQKKIKRKKQEKELINDSGRTSASSSMEDENRALSCSNETSSKSNKKHKPVKRKSDKSDPLLEIRSKTQKMIREGRIALPYHQPKQRSLDEFLQRRNSAPSIPLNLSSDSLYLVSERLTRREKEVVEFYKSDSGEENTPTDDKIEKVGEEENLFDEDKTEKAEFDTSKDAPIIATNSAELNAETETCSNSPNVINEIPPIDSNVELVITDRPLAAIAVELEGHNVEKENNFQMNIDSCVSTELDASCKENVFINARPSAVPSNTESSDAFLELEDSAPVEESVNEVQEVSTENADRLLAKVQNEDSEKIDNSQVADSYLDSDIHLHLDTGSIDSARELESKEKYELENNEKSSNDLSNSSSSSDDPQRIEESNITNVVEAANKDDCQPDSEDFQLVIQDSYNSVEDPPSFEKEKDMTKPSSEVDMTQQFIRNEDAIRSRKLALLSKYNIDISADPKLNIEPSLPIKFEIEVPGIFELRRKLEKHIVVPSKPKQKSTKLSIISTRTDSEGEVVDVVKEVLMLKSPADVEDDSSQNKFSLPGSKHTRFRDTMLKALVSKKEANWSKYQQEKSKLYSSDGFDDLEDDTDYGGRKLDFEPYHPEEEPDDDDLIEDDIELEDRKKKKNYFLDEEADVSFDEEENIDLSENAGSDEENCDNIDEDSDENEDEEKEEDEDEDEEEEEVKDEENSVKNVPNCSSDEEEKDNDECKEEDDKNSNLTNRDVLNSSKNDNFKEPFDVGCTEKIFKHDISGTALENKLLGLESFGSQTPGLSQEITNSQIFSLCSGKFVTQPSNNKNVTDSSNVTESQIVEDSQNFDLSMLDTSDGVPAAKTKGEAVNDRSQLLFSDDSDTEELFIKKKKALRIEDSDDESEKPSQKLDLADPIDDDEDNLNDEGDDEDVPDEEDDQNTVVYDSEEEIVNYKETVTKEFFENEAELSESEWGSEDENEKDLDVLEQEAGDAEVIDTDKLKEELGKIHMRQLLDDDQKEVRLLQEMLLEDGEMHSNRNRQRKFQWKNLDGEDFFLKGFNDSDEENVVNDENDVELEENWRKIRHEREAFLSQQEKKHEHSLLNIEHKESDFVEVTTTAKIITETSVRERVLDSSKSPTVKLPFNAQHKCGSFLSRGKMLLNRIAITVGESKDNVQGRVKNSRNFVFGARSPEKEIVVESAVEKTEKRKISSKNLMTRKKLKLSTDADAGLPLKKHGLLAQLALSE